MNYRQEQLRNALAAEYVLGTLDGGARRRFQQLMMQSQSIRETTWVWEQHLNGLGSKLPPVDPDPRVWQAIERQLRFTQTTVAQFPKVAAKIKRFWQSTTLLATAAALVLAILLSQQIGQLPDVAPQSQHIAVFQNEQDVSLWFIHITQDNIKVQSTKDLAQKPQNDYQLWMVAKDGRPPIPLGILPQTGSVLLPKHALFDQLDIAALAVSLEPIGGSPTGSPTTVLFTAKLAST